MMGETRDQLKEQAEHKAQDAKERGKRVAEEAQKTAKEEASNQDLKS
jgi:F0F1-type ATP synthase membrane subunit b/b'